MGRSIPDFGEDVRREESAQSYGRIWYNTLKEKLMGLVKTRRLAAMQKQQRAKAAFKPPKPSYQDRGKREGGEVNHFANGVRNV